MTTENTLTKLNEMRMTAMAETFREQLRNPEYQELSFEDRFGLLVDIEWARRQNNKLDRLVRQQNYGTHRHASRILSIIRTVNWIRR